MATVDNLSVVKAFSVLEIVCRSDGIVTLGRIADEAKLPVATAHRLLRTLKTIGAVRITRRGGYDFGTLLANLSTYWHSRRSDIRASILPSLFRLSAGGRYLAQLAILDDEEMVSFVASSGVASEQYASDRVERFESYCLGAGHVLLAGLPRAKAIAYTQGIPFTALTAHTITDPDQLLARLDHVRVNGYAIERGEFADGRCSLSVPVFDDEGATIAAVSLSSDDGLYRSELDLDLLPGLRQTAAAISLKLSGLGDHGHDVGLLDDAIVR